MIIHDNLKLHEIQKWYWDWMGQRHAESLLHPYISTTYGRPSQQFVHTLWICFQQIYSSLCYISKMSIGRWATTKFSTYRHLLYHLSACSDKLDSCSGTSIDDIYFEYAYKWLGKVKVNILLISSQFRCLVLLSQYFTWQQTYSLFNVSSPLHVFKKDPIVWAGKIQFVPFPTRIFLCVSG